MNKYILSKQKDYIIYEYNLENDLILEWSIDRYINEFIDEVCTPYCQYSYAIDAIIDNLEDELSDEDFRRCDTCNSCSNIELIKDLTEQDLKSIQIFLSCGDPNSITSIFNISKWESSMVSNKSNKYLGEFYSIKECRESLNKNLLTFD